MNQRQIRDSLAQHVLYQDAALNRVSREIWHALQPRRPSEGQAIRITTALLSGVSGTGKTLVCEQLRQLMLAGKGQQYEAQFIESHLAGLNEVGSTKFSGCSAGWVGYGAVSFAEKFKQAVQPVRGKPPPYIFVQMDELDKSCGALECLNSLLDRGQIELTAELEQIVPDPSTTLIIFFTANYGAEAIEEWDSMKSVEAIKSCMRRQQIQDCDIGRLRTIIPFKAFTEQEILGIFRAKYAQLAEEHPLTSKFCAPTLGDLVQAELSRCVLVHYDPRLGVRDAMALYTREVTDWLYMILFALEDTTDKVELFSESETVAIDSEHATLAEEENFTNAERLHTQQSREEKCVTLIITHCQGRVVSRFVPLPGPEQQTAAESVQKQAKTL